ncbi:hypothetical protein CAPTEDRAFT_99758 [Capitella teleta]|uniref:Innexin n=1 Tax=Capitella teleta TaxID=283909 RepID=R7UVR0_CAPTE|nr:hypothetical protein CAPTEDRAFT_99758 [Capitella teleta]|eukprot:ELU10683.1 hypothetical protein CAPTEDRAFT_99758 [Capitella teleta]
MDKLLGVFGQIGDTKVRQDDDYVDKLNHRYTTFILVIFAIVVSTKQYVGEPINCWCPAQFTDNHEDFTNKICWVSNTYYVPIAQKIIPEEHEPKARLSYYQWVPMILLCQALLFYMPCMLWRFLNNKSGVDVNSVVEASMTLQHTAYADSRDKTVRFMAKHMDRYLGSTRDARRTGCGSCLRLRMTRTCCLFCGRRYGNYLVLLYLIVKVFYLGNAVGQLFLLNAFLGTNYHAYGYEVLIRLIRNQDWTSVERFPRVTLCDFNIRNLGNIHRHTVQCVLPINLFNEKIYIFVWFWFVFVALANIVSLVTWLARAVLRVDQVRYVRQHLRALDKIDKKTDRRLVSRFVSRYLRQDGILVLRIIGINANELVVADLLAELWNQFRLSSPGMMSHNHRDGNGLRQDDIGV